jgi:hypothetical protein
VVIIEEWTAWFLVRERERDLARKQRLREAERVRPRSRTTVVTLPRKPSQLTPPPRDRRAA